MTETKEIEEITKCIGAVILKNTSRPTPARELAAALYNAGYRLCGGDSCPNFKHYEAECKKCTDKQELITTLQIEDAKEQAVKEFAEKLQKAFESVEGHCRAENDWQGKNAAVDCMALLDQLKKKLYGKGGE